MKLDIIHTILNIKKDNRELLGYTVVHLDVSNNFQFFGAH